MKLFLIKYPNRKFYCPKESNLSFSGYCGLKKTLDLLRNYNFTDIEVIEYKTKKDITKPFLIGLMIFNLNYSFKETPKKTLLNAIKKYNDLHEILCMFFKVHPIALTTTKRYFLHDPFYRPKEKIPEKKEEYNSLSSGENQELLGENNNLSLGENQELLGEIK